MKEDQFKLAAFLLMGLLTFFALVGSSEIPSRQGIASLSDDSTCRIVK